MNKEQVEQAQKEQAAHRELFLREVIMGVKKYTMVERSMWILDCPNCEYRAEDISDKRPGKERQCPECKTWVPWEQQTFTSKEYEKYERRTG